jgi:hypothetical protein
MSFPLRPIRSREDVRHARDMDRIDRFAYAVDRIIDKAGPSPEPKIAPSNGGFELLLPALMTNGKWELKREAWSRNRADVVASAKLRGLSL